jgi:hypothetical protein
MACAIRRARGAPSLLLGCDIDAMRTQAGIDRALLNALRRFGILPPEPPKPPRIRLVKTEE